MYHIQKKKPGKSIIPNFNCALKKHEFQCVAEQNTLSARILIKVTIFYPSEDK